MIQPPNLNGAPEWFLEVIGRRPEPRQVITEDGIRIHYECWNPADTCKPPLLLLHGFLAHSRAWDAVAPYLCDRYQVFAMDWAGMGESEHREDYDADTYDRDFRAVTDVISPGPITLVGHSFGGGRVIIFAGRHPDRVRHAIAIDSFMLFTDLPNPSFSRLKGRMALYPDYDSVVARYRPVPQQPAEPWMLNYMAHHSVRRLDEGWTWKFDYRMGNKASVEDGAAQLAAVTVPLDVIFGELSVMKDDERIRRMVTLPARARGPVIIPQAHHHIMLDQPLALVSALRALLV